MSYYYKTFTQLFPEAESYYMGLAEDMQRRYNELASQLGAMGKWIAADYDAIINRYSSALLESSRRLSTAIGRAESEYRTTRDATMASMDRAASAAAGRMQSGMAFRGLGQSTLAEAFVNEIHRENELDKAQVREQYGAGLANLIFRGGVQQAEFDDSGERFIAGLGMGKTEAKARTEMARIGMLGQGIASYGAARSAWLDRRYQMPMMMRRRTPFWHRLASSGSAAGISLLGGVLDRLFGGSIRRSMIDDW